MSHTICRLTRLVARSICTRLLRMRSIYKFFLLASIAFWLVMILYQMVTSHNQALVQRCYQKNNIFDRVTAHKIELLEDVSIASKKPTLDKTIFFHETSCLPSGLVELTARQACAIESAALTHPDHDVFVLFASPVGFLKAGQSETPSNSVVEAVRRLPNVHLRNVNMWTYARDTPIDEWLNAEKPQLFTSNHFRENIADFLRFLSLYKYGGICLNLDVVVQKSLVPLGINYVGLDREETILTAVLSLSATGNGHTVAEILLREFAKCFKSTMVLNGYGEDTINYVLRKLCNVLQVNRDSRNRCSGINLLEQKMFYPIREEDWRMLFDGKVADFVHEASSSSYAVHFWERQSSEKRLVAKHAENKKLDGHSDLASYLQIAQENCPGVYAAAGNYF